MAGIYVNRGGTTWDNVGRTELKVNIGGSTWVNPRRVYVNRGGTNWGSPIWVYDETAPTGGQINGLAWSDGVRGFNVAYAAVSDESGIAEYSLQYSTNNSSFTGIGSLSTSGGVFPHTLPLGDRNGTVWYRTYMRDTVGNERVSSPSFGGTPKPYGSFTVTPTDWDTWETGAGGGGATWKGYDSGQSRNYLWSGYVSSTWANQYGFWFYGSNAFYTKTKGYTPDSATVFYNRTSTSGGNGDVYFALHGHSTRPGTPNLTAYDPWSGPGGTQGYSHEGSLSLAARQNIATNGSVGIFMYPGVANNSSYYRVVDSPSISANSGRVTLNYTV